METLVKRLFQTATLRRALIETWLVSFTLTLFILALYAEQIPSLYATSFLFLINPSSGLWYAFRLRPAQGRRFKQLRVEILWLTVAVAVIYFGTVTLVMRTWMQPPVLESLNPLVELILIVLIVFPFVFFRALTRLWVWWEHKRERRLIWSLVHSHLVAAALFQALIALPIMLLMAFQMSSTSGAVNLPQYPISLFIFRLQMILPLVGMAILAVTALLILLLPISVVVSYFFARRIRKRLDALMDAAHAAGDGSYQVRVPVTGNDEISKLQTDFNAMVSKLESTVNALRNEQETVRALLKSRHELMASVSHELRTPIATIRAYLESARRQQSSTSDQDMEIIEQEVIRLQALIDDLFALSRAEVQQLSFQLAPVDLPALIHRIVEAVGPVAWRVQKIEVIESVPVWLPPVRADTMRLEQVLRNLLHNSLRYTPPGGVIILSARLEHGEMHIEVRDTGSGIAPEDLPHIWERFYHDDTNGGSGLGLALVKSFTEAMGGRVHVTSELGDGSCFSLVLPLAATPTSDETLPQPKPISRSSRNCDNPATSPR